MNPQNAPAVVVPMNEDMATEPARTIGQRFADQAFVRTIVGAVITVVGIAAPHVASGIDDNEANAISLIVLLIASAFATWKAKATPKQQAAQTREAVYSPQSVADLTSAEQPGKPVDAVVIPSPAPKAS